MSLEPLVGPITLGIDPAIANVGWSVVHRRRLIGAGLIQTSPALDEVVRYELIARTLESVIAEYHPTEAAIEEFEAIYTSDEPESSGSGVDLPGLRLPSGLALPALAGMTMPGQKKKRRSTHDRKKMKPRDLFVMKGAQAIVQFTCFRAGLAIHRYLVREWKGDARRKKESVQAEAGPIYVRDLGPIPSELWELQRLPGSLDNNVADAIMVGMHHEAWGRHLHRDGSGVSLADAESDNVKERTRAVRREQTRKRAAAKRLKALSGDS